VLNALFSKIMSFMRWYGGARGATNDVTRRIRVVCWISKTTRAHKHAHAHAPGHPPPPTHTHTQIAFRERVSVLHCLSCSDFGSLLTCILLDKPFVTLRTTLNVWNT
jgi:hypothetical protein